MVAALLKQLWNHFWAPQGGQWPAREVCQGQGGKMVACMSHWYSLHFPDSPLPLSLLLLRILSLTPSVMLFPRIPPPWSFLIVTHAATILTDFIVIHSNLTYWWVPPPLFFCEAFPAPWGPGGTPPLPPHGTHITFISKYSNYLFTHLSLLWALKGQSWILLISALPASGTQ